MTGKNKSDLIINHLIDIKTDIGGIKQHLKDMNGSIKRHDEDIDGNRKSIGSIKNRQFYFMGASASVVILSSIIFALIKFKYGG